MTSPARNEANRKNAQKSTGPRTEEGKRRSRLNGLVHGLRSAEVVLPTESRDEFDAHLGRWMNDWNPPTEARRLLVERAATAAWKLRRCTRVETERMSRRSNEAVRDWDRASDESVERALRALPKEVHNARSLAVLRSTRAGVDRLIDLWEGLAEALDTPGGWSDGDAHHNGLLTLLGLFGPDDEMAEIGDHSWGLLLSNRPDLVGTGDEPTDPGQVDALRSILAGLCRMKVEELEGRWLALPDPGSARVSVGEEAAFTFDAQDLNLHRHEARLDREARAAIAQLTRLEQTGADLRALDRSESGAEPAIAIAPTEPNPARPTEPEPAPVSPTEPNATPPIAASLPVDRDRDGRTWPLSAWVGMPDVSSTP